MPMHSRALPRHGQQPAVNVDWDSQFLRDWELARCCGGRYGAGEQSPPRQGLHKPAYGDGTLATGCSLHQRPRQRNTCALSVTIQRFPKGEQSTPHKLTLYFIVFIYRNAVVARQAEAQPVPVSPLATPHTSTLEES